MKKREAYYNTIFAKYLDEKKLYCYYELKQTGGQDTFNFAKIEKGQWSGLQATEKSGLLWKLSDEISRPKPCDGFNTPPLPSYLVIKFNDEFCLIRFGEIVKLKYEGVISITKKKAEEISEKIIKV